MHIFNQISSDIPHFLAQPGELFSVPLPLSRRLRLVWCLRIENGHISLDFDVDFLLLLQKRVHDGEIPGTLALLDCSEILESLHDLFFWNSQHSGHLIQFDPLIVLDDCVEGHWLQFLESLWHNSSNLNYGWKYIGDLVVCDHKVEKPQESADVLLLHFREAIWDLILWVSGLNAQALEVFQSTWFGFFFQENVIDAKKSDWLLIDALEVVRRNLRLAKVFSVLLIKRSNGFQELDWFVIFLQQEVAYGHVEEQGQQRSASLR